MPRITDIQPQKRRSDIYNVYLDGKFRFALSDLALSNADLHIGSELADDRVEGLVHQAQFGKAWTMALYLLSRRQRSETEMRTYLQGKQFEPGVVDEVIQKLLAEDLLNDQRFAQAWVTDRQTLKPRSNRALIAEMRQKGLLAEVIECVMQQRDETAEVDSATALIRKKQKHPAFADEHKLVTYLLRQGYSYGSVKKALAGLTGSEHEPQGHSYQNQPQSNNSHTTSLYSNKVTKLNIP